MSGFAETDLYWPVKAFLERQGYCVKGEVADADVVACREDEPPLIVELKAGFSLALLHQGVARLSITDAVYLCVPRRDGAVAWRALKDNVKLCRRLGLGVMTVRMRDQLVEVHRDPGPYAPRKSKPRQRRLLREFARRRGDPAAGGARSDRQITAYRQDALSVANHLAGAGPTRGAHAAHMTGVTNATKIMRDNHYGWFERVATGTYTLTAFGQAALDHYGPPHALETDIPRSRPALEQIGPPPTPSHAAR